MIRCSACRKGTLAPGRTKNHDIGPLFGLEGAFLDDAPALICNQCGHVMLEGETIEAARHRLAEVIISNGTLLTGAEVRFLRETMDMTQAQLADRLNIIRGTVTRWEAGEDLGAVQSFALRVLAAWALADEGLARAVSAPEAPRPSALPKPYHLELPSPVVVDHALQSLRGEQGPNSRSRK